VSEYSFQVNAGVTGLSQVQALGAETDKQIDRTKKIDESLKAYLATHDKAIKSQETYAATSEDC
jgi:hypothetical protein